jgi:hypothetical protein
MEVTLLVKRRFIYIETHVDELLTKPLTTGILIMINIWKLRY